MRPTPAETIAGVRRILRDVVEPEVGSEYARSRLREVRAVLAQIDWDDAALHLRRQSDAMLELLAETRAWIDADPARAREFADVDLQPPTPARGTESFTELNSVRARCGELLANVADRLAVWIRSHPENPDGRKLLMRLMRHMPA